MKRRTDKIQEPQTPITPKVTSEPSTGGTAQLMDNRTSTINDRKLQKTMNGSAQGNINPIQRKVNKTGLPDNLKSGIENLSGYSMDDVKVHYNSRKPAQLQAHAYAQGTDIHIGPGQQKHLPHEAWHVVQQKQGRVKPTKQLKSKVNINDDIGLEKEADVMGMKAISAGETTRRALSQVTEGGHIPTKVKGESVFQLLAIQPGQFNMVGEHHTKTKSRQRNENYFADTHMLTIKRETDYKWQDTDGKHIFGDPTYIRLRRYALILISLCDNLQENVDGVGNEQRMKDWKHYKKEFDLQLIRYIQYDGKLPSEIGRVNDPNNTRRGEIKRIYDGITNLISDMERVEEAYAEWKAYNAEETAGTADPMVKGLYRVKFITYCSDVKDILAGLKNDVGLTHVTGDQLDQDRSIEMHKMAQSRHRDPVLWIVGEWHIQDIRGFANSADARLNALPAPIYNLVDEADFNKDVDTYAGGTITGTALRP
ncbi:DUF4157 domain-containing protein [Aquimarina aggregata]|uniref:eCIS core domain-containing protein n=1 Tax=Aquimarina aggregata TaxID=1642818 RepID=UPI0024900748|nr:DUF4157 domain-containing protein [Aquimarina aggregata]